MKFNTTPATPALVVANAMMVMAMMAIAYGPVAAQDLQREFIDPAGVFTQVVTVADRGVKTSDVSGQVGHVAGYRGRGSGGRWPRLWRVHVRLGQRLK